ncbi:glycosyltransferase family A protein [Cecembia lonarensis]|uniref:Glycosyl transferase family 2 n=1 Tax=Cecembia lonarensis (strain CCUG 58316 / KCTC 22772 / LW9) TaxID=1225176 RepID=K1L1S4_CECL9|nr:glycosyltransferase family A protein [Cecembia lonarensis]EKB48711.1 Glycosyl transferase family 2 [Cecembia lonarensis LW9]
MTVISIVVFIYNPDEWIIKKVLKALTELKIPQNGEVEYLLVDNNSQNNWKLILEREFTDFPFQLLVEKRQGLTFARQSGFEKSKGDLIVCVDDDNELSSDYLLSFLALREQYPEVGVWGPGIIKVEFHKDVPSKFNNFKAYYQEKAFDKVQFGTERIWMPYYPPGTGMCLTKEVANAYLGFVEKGRMTATDRKGRSLSSGGDSQVVYSAILLGKSAGTSPSLKLNHLTSKNKSNLNYLKRLQFGIYSCTPVHVEVFPELKEKIKKPKIYEFLDLVLRTFIKSRFGKNKSKFQLPLAKKLGIIQGYYDTYQLSVPWVYRFFINKLGLK